MSVNLPEPFHPAIRGWFDAQFGAPTACQSRAWETIATGANTLIAAPTGSGKTLAAFLCAIDRLVRASEHGDLPNETRVLYVSPLKALGNDIQRNLEQPLDDIAARMVASGAPDPGIATAVRTGDTPAAARQAMLRRAPHILVTTPESLYILLTSDGGRGLLERIETVIVDEIHAVAGDKRGAHLALSLERLDALVGQPVQRIGLSATQRPIERIAAFLTGRSSHACHIVDEGHHRGRDLGLEVTATPLAAVMANEAWEEIYDRLAALIDAHQTTLIFVNTRRLAERVSRHLVTRLNEEQVAAHHGSMSKEKRLRAEQRLKGGELRALVATASLELGIDIGDVDLVCQLGSTHRISTFLQRVGRAGHGVGRTPKGRLFPLSRDDLVECSALIKAATDGMLDALHVPRGAVDVLAQHVVAECCAGPQAEDQLYERFANAYPYQGLDRTTFDQVLRMLAEGYATRRGQQGAYLHRDAVNGMVEARPNARLVALSAGGAIPETADYAVVAEPEGLAVGTLDEDFAIESIPGDIFQLGNTSWQILRVETNTVRVADAQGAPPTIPFWLGEAPSRTDELSEMVNAIRERIGNADPSPEPTGWDTLYADTATELGIPIEAARQLVDYLLAGARSLGCMPTQRTPILERFFDQSGGMQLVIHAPYGARINRAWGLALRKRFCKSFNFELQAAATEDNIVLSLGETHSFSLSDVEHYLSPNSVVDVLKQALIDAPMFTARWRWNTNVSLAVPRMRAGKKVPPPIQRMQAEDLISVVFPDSIACAENLTGKRDIPDHPLVTQTFEDALHGGMDVDGLVELLTDLANGKTTMHCVDAIEPSPFAAEIIAARPYAYLDDAPLEERRTRAVSPPRDI
ncbi:MAG: DEAD/DEAH box helicase, partial [Pseudomonadota bacterium]